MKSQTNFGQTSFDCFAKEIYNFLNWDNFWQFKKKCYYYKQILSTRPEKAINERLSPKTISKIDNYWGVVGQGCLDAIH